MIFAEVQTQPEGHPGWRHRHVTTPEMTAVKFMVSALICFTLFAIFFVRPWYKKRRRSKHGVGGRVTPSPPRGRKRRRR